MDDVAVMGKRNTITYFEKDVEEPVAIRDIKRFVAERDTGRWKSKLEIAADKGKKVAVVGGGPAGSFFSGCRI